MAASGLFLSCEHGGNRVPARYARHFAGTGKLLATHRGYDIGSLEAARFLRARLDVPLISATVTRLLVDLNRSPAHPRLFSEITRTLDTETRRQILRRHYQPHRDKVQAMAKAGISASGRVIHLSVHSFTPEMNGHPRHCDIGLLYDPSRHLEAEFCDRWRRRLRSAEPALIVRRNYPYRGVADGLVTYLRRRFDARRYIGVEIEINQALAKKGGPQWKRLLSVLADTLPA